MSIGSLSVDHIIPVEAALVAMEEVWARSDLWSASAYLVSQNVNPRNPATSWPTRVAIPGPVFVIILLAKLRLLTASKVSGYDFLD